MEVVIDSGVIAFPIAVRDASNVWYDPDHIVCAVFDVDGMQVGTPTISSPTITGGSGRSVVQLRVAPTALGGYVAGQSYTVAAELWQDATPTETQFYVFGPFRVVASETPAAVDARLSSQHGTGSWQRNVIAGSAPVVPPTPITGAQLVARAGHTFAIPPFILDDDDSAGWTGFVFVVKRDAATDDDDDALLLIRLTNPSDADDGLIRMNGRAAQDKTLASIVVTVVDGTTTITVDIAAAGMNVAPTGAETPYVFELARWRGEIKEPIAEGTFAPVRVAHRGPFAAS